MLSNTSRRYWWKRSVLSTFAFFLTIFACLGVAGSYTWHWVNNNPVERRVEVTQSTVLPYRKLDDTPSFITHALPEMDETGLAVAQALKSSGESFDVEEPSNGVTLLPHTEATVHQSIASNPNGNNPLNIGGVSIDELPITVRRRMPTIKYNSHIFSSDDRARKISLNGNVYHEGESIGGGLSLIKIRPNESVFLFEGHSFIVEALNDW